MGQRRRGRGDLFALAERDPAPCDPVPPPDDPGSPRRTDGAPPAHGGARSKPDDVWDGGNSLPAGGDEVRFVARLVARDETAFNTLVRAYERRVFALLVRMTGSRAEAEDLAQEVFVQVFKAIGSFRGESKLSTWIYRIAINLSKNRSKYLRVRHADQQEQLEEIEQRAALVWEAPSASFHAMHRPDELIAGRQLERIVQNAILELEPGFRECLVLRDIEDLSYDEIGGILGIAEGTVKSRIHRARAQLKALVERALGEKIA
jgi:RNA polymerase sigma-70 factor (ECF subfamily)